MSDDPVRTDPDKYEVIFENDRVRVLEYRDVPGGHGTGSRLLAAGPDPRGREHRHHAHARAVRRAQRRQRGQPSSRHRPCIAGHPLPAGSGEPPPFM